MMRAGAGQESPEFLEKCKLQRFSALPFGDEFFHFDGYPFQRFPRYRREAARLWQQIFGRKCPLCGVEMHWLAVRKGALSKTVATVDHYLARGLGGTDALSNLWFICHECNREKSKIEGEECARRRLAGTHTVFLLAAKYSAARGSLSPSDWHWEKLLSDACKEVLQRNGLQENGIEARIVFYPMKASAA